MQVLKLLYQSLSQYWQKLASLFNLVIYKQIQCLHKVFVLYQLYTPLTHKSFNINGL
jgi:hypothetical protein